MPEEFDDLQKLCEILHVGTHRPRLVFQMKDAKVLSGTMDLTDNLGASNPSWKLMPVAMERELDGVTNSVQKLLAQYTVRFKSREINESTLGDETFQVKNLYLVPLLSTESLLSQLEEQDTRMKKIVADWTEDPTKLSNAIREKVGQDVFNIVQKYIPPAQTLRDSTSITAISFPLAAGTIASTAANARQFTQAARQRTRALISQVTENLFAQPRDELAAAVRELDELISRDGRVTAKSIVPVRRAVEKLKLFDFAADDGLKRQIQAMETKLDGITPSEQTSTVAMQNGLLNILKSVRESAQSDVAIKTQVQRHMRRVSL